MNLVVVGTLAFDSVETPFGKRQEILGGSATFLATSASYFTKVQMVGIVGEDFPDEHLEFFQSRGIDTAGVDRVVGRTFRWSGVYEYDLNVRHTLETQLNVLEQFEPDLPAAYRSAEYVVLGNLDPEMQLAVLDQLEKPKLVAADTMDFWIEGHRKALDRMLSRVDILLVNDAEARQLSGEYNLTKAAHAIRALGPRILVIKQGEFGALLFDGDAIFSAPGFPVEVIQDPTGAGDSFAGGMMGFLARRGKEDPMTLRQAMIMGSVTASFSVEDFSIDRIRDIPEDELRQRFSQFETLSHFEAHDDSLWN
ncbi:MAG: PfkB family carbohydrate kinase [Myxococcota bacterium]